jgi:hypothetical protein
VRPGDDPMVMHVNADYHCCSGAGGTSMSRHQNEERRVVSHAAQLADVSCWHEPREDNRLIVNITCACGVPLAIWKVPALRFAHCQFKVCGAADVLVGGVCSFHTHMDNRGTRLMQYGNAATATLQCNSAVPG